MKERNIQNYTINQPELGNWILEYQDLNVLITKVEKFNYPQ